MMNATQLGQLAMEYMDDRQHEFEELVKAVRRDKHARGSSLKASLQKRQEKRRNVGKLVRGDVSK